MLTLAKLIELSDWGLAFFAAGVFRRRNDMMSP